jgi:hypothetical protein
MAASLQSHFHIVDSATPGDTTTTGEWVSMAPGLKPKSVPEYKVIASPRRTLTGVLRPHVLKSGSTPVLITDYSLFVKCSTWTEVETWRDYLGTTKYLIYHWHDPNAHNSYTQQVYIDKIGEPQIPGPTFPVIYLPVHLMDASQ